MDGQTVAIDEDFTSSERGVLPSERTTKDEPTTTEVPPLHPSCRCIVVTEQIEPELGPAGPIDYTPPEKEPEPAPKTDAFGNQLPGFADLAGVLQTLEAQDAGAVHALAFDGGDLERLELRLAQVDAHPGDLLSTEVQFKLTEAAKTRLLEEARRADSEWRDLTHLSIPKRVGNVMKWDDPAFASNDGRTYELIKGDGTRIRVHASDRGSRGAFAFDGMVQAWLPPVDNEAASVEALMKTVGVKDVSYPTEKAADAYARNQAAALFRTSASQSAKAALDGAARVFGLDPADLRLAPGLNGQIEVRVPQAVADNIMSKTDTRYFTHSITSRNTEEQTVQMIADMVDGGMKSTTTRWTEGLGGAGQSSARDVGTGGADYVFTRQITEDGLQNQGGTTFVFRGDRLLQRTDWYAYESDTFGVQNAADRLGPSVASRDSVRNLAANYGGSQETMFRGRIDTADLHRLVISDNGRRSAVIKELERRGITTIDGVALRSVIVPYAGYVV